MSLKILKRNCDFFFILSIVMQFLQVRFPSTDPTHCLEQLSAFVPMSSLWLFIYFSLFLLLASQLYYFVSTQGMHPAFIGAQYPFSMSSGPQPPMAATAVTFPGVPVPSMTQIAVHPYHAETGLPLSTTVTGPPPFLLSKF